MQYLLRLYQTAIPQTNLCSDRESSNLGWLRQHLAITAIKQFSHRSNAASFALSGRIVSVPVPWRTSSPLLQNLISVQTDG
jgi:hypothetical protein